MLHPDLVNSIIAQYEKTVAPDLVVLLRDAKILSTQAYYYSSALSQAHKAYRQNRIIRKKIYAKTLKKLMDRGQTATAAKVLVDADDSYIEALKEEENFFCLYEEGKFMLKSISLVISRMNQEIADLRTEKQYNRFTGGEYGNQSSNNNYQKTSYQASNRTHQNHQRTPSKKRLGGNF